MYHEGRIHIADQEGFVLLNVYLPKKKAKKLLISLDPDKARKKIELTRPKWNEKTSGFLPGEGTRIYKFIGRGYIDMWRALHSKPAYPTWWDLESRARDRNVGWCYDYFFVSDNLRKYVVSSYMLLEAMDSGHCLIRVDVLVPD